MASINPGIGYTVTQGMPNFKVKRGTPLTLKGEYNAGGWTLFRWFKNDVFLSDGGSITAPTDQLGFYSYSLEVLTDERRWRVDKNFTPTATAKITYEVEAVEGAGNQDYNAVNICSSSLFIYNPLKDLCEGLKPTGFGGMPQLTTEPPNPANACPSGGRFDKGKCVFTPGAPGADGTPAPPPPPPPPAPVAPTSITISVYTGNEQGYGGGADVAKVYQVNETLPNSINAHWFVNGSQKSVGAKFNYLKEYAKDGDKIYAQIENTTTRSNTLIYNASGADGAGAPPPNPTDIDGDGIPDAEDDDIDGDGVKNEDDDDIDGDGIENDEDPTPAGNSVSTYDTLYTRASQAQYLGDVFHADPTHTNPAPAKEESGFSLPTPLLLMAGLAGGYFIYTNSKKR